MDKFCGPNIRALTKFNKINYGLYFPCTVFYET